VQAWRCGVTLAIQAQVAGVQFMLAVAGFTGGLQQSVAMQTSEAVVSIADHAGMVCPATTAS
jgi:hypothetical protein